MSSEVERAVEFRALGSDARAGSESCSLKPGARHRAVAHARSSEAMASTPAPQDTAEAIHRAALIDRIQSFEHDPDKFVPAKPVEAPPGMPIGDDE